MSLQKLGAQLAALASYGFLFSSLLTSPTTAAFDVNSLDAAILQDVLESYANHEPTTCAGAAGSTTFTFAYPGLNTDSEWNTVFQSFEEDVFLAAMTLNDPIGNRSCTIRLGKAGNMYSHFCPDMHGETFPPQHHVDAPWVDEVHQSVSVNTNLNGATNMCNGGACPANFVHGAGTYQRDDPYTNVPFYSQGLAKYCAGDSCIFAAWGQQAHLATIFTSSVMMFNKYTNCGNGTIEHTQMIHNFAPDDTLVPSSYVDQTYFNVPWSGVRRSSLPIALEPNYATGELSYEDPNTVDYCLMCPWNNPDHDRVGGDQDMGGGRCARAWLRDIGGYTTFVQPGLLINHELPAIQKHMWCRKPNADCSLDPGGCMARPSECYDASGNLNPGYTPVELEVPAGATPSCTNHNGIVEGYQTLKCNMRATGFGQSTPYLNAEQSVDECAPWLGAEMGLYRTDNGKGIKIPYVRHWSWSPSNRLLYFSVYSQDLNEAINLVNNMFDNRSSGTPLSIRFQTFEPGQVQTNAGPDYNPGELNAVTFVYGKGEDYQTFGGSVPGQARRRIGSANRDYNVFTVNYLSTGAKLQPGDTYSNRAFVVASDLGSAKSIANSLSPKVVADKINLERWNPRAIDIYKSGASFDAVAAASVGGVSTTCTSTSAALECSGYSTPHPGHVPFFFITCGASSYLGSDPYYYTPGNKDWFSFPGMSNNNSQKIRSYACAGEVESVRPTWKLIGFFNPATCTSLGADFTYDDNICNDPRLPSTSFSPTPPPTPEPTTAAQTPDPTQAPSSNPTSLPTPEPTTAAQTPDPTQAPSSNPTSPPFSSAMHSGTDGCSTNGVAHSELCLYDTALHAVNCCSGSENDGNLSCSRPDCFRGQKMNFTAAMAHCESAGMRLCTVAELDSGACCLKGCWFDDEMGWAADSCTATAPTEAVTTASPTPEPTEADTTVSPTPAPTEAPGSPTQQTNLIPVNLALQGVASQSSTCYGGEASRAIDGNTDGHWHNGSVLHTCMPNRYSWWKVDLRGVHTITSVSIYNRSDCCGDRITDAVVEVLDSAGNIVASRLIAAGDVQDVYNFDFGGVQGRYVRFRKRVIGTINIAEVEVMGFSST